MNAFYKKTVQLLLDIVPLIFQGNFFALKAVQL